MRMWNFSDIDDFIVDDEGRPISKGKKKKHIIHSDKWVVLFSFIWFLKMVCVLRTDFLFVSMYFMG